MFLGPQVNVCTVVYYYLFRVLTEFYCFLLLACYYEAFGEFDFWELYRTVVLSSLKAVANKVVRLTGPYAYCEIFVFFFLGTPRVVTTWLQFPTTA